VNEAHIFMDEDDPEEFYIEEIIKGDTAEQVLSRLQYSPSELVRMVKTCVDQRVRTGHIRPREGVSLIDRFEDVISGYTYLRKNKSE
jgi:arginine decarboxylase